MIAPLFAAIPADGRIAVADGWGLKFYSCRPVHVYRRTAALGRGEKDYRHRLFVHGNTSGNHWLIAGRHLSTAGSH